MDHRADARSERGAAEYSFDYSFSGDEFGYRLTTLVGKERKKVCGMAATVSTKVRRCGFEEIRCLSSWMP